jgi:fatty acid desaturase
MNARYWYILGNAYDLFPIYNSHPGGTLMLDLMKGQDCTNVVRSSHMIPFPKMLDMIENYRIDGVCDPNYSNTDIIDDPFHDDVKTMIRKYRKQHGTKMTWLEMIYGCTVGCLWLYSVRIWFTGSISFAFLFPTLNWLIVSTFTHEGSHGAISHNPLTNLVASCSAQWTWDPVVWYFQHIVSHHQHTNDKDDTDLYHADSLLVRVSWWRIFPRRSVLSLSCSMLIYISVSSVHLTIMLPLRLLFEPCIRKSGRPIFKQIYNITHFNSRMYWLLCSGLLFRIIFIGATFWYVPPLVACLNLIILYTLSSVIFMLFTQVSHIQGQCQVPLHERSWAKRQVLSSMNYCVKSDYWNILSAGLNHQSIHHIVPTLSKSHFTHVWDAFMMICAKHNVDVPVLPTYTDALRSFLHHVYDLNVIYPDRIHAKHT